MKISRIKLTNILGIDDIDFKPGDTTEITGKNGVGKTSIIEGIKSVLKGGNDATILRNGADKGEVVLEFDNEMSFYKQVTNGKSKTEVYDRLHNKLAAPQSIIDKMVDLLSVNPVEFLLSSKKDRTKILLDTLPLTLDAEKIRSAISNTDINMIVTEGNALEVINTVHKKIYDERTTLNRLIKEKDGAIEQLRASIHDFDYDVEELRSNIDELESRMTNITSQKDKYMNDIYEQESKEIEELTNKYLAEKEAIQNSYSEKRDKLLSQYKTKFVELNGEHSKNKQQLEIVGSVAKTKELIKQYDDESSKLTIKSDEYSKALDNLNNLKLSLLNELPIPGLIVEDGEIYKDGILFERLNTAEQIKIAIEVAKLRAGELQLVCVDGLERFDDETYTAFKGQMKESGLQAIVTRVTNTDLQIVSE